MHYLTLLIIYGQRLISTYYPVVDRPLLYCAYTHNPVSDKSSKIISTDHRGSFHIHFSLEPFFIINISTFSLSLVYYIQCVITNKKLHKNKISINLFCVFCSWVTCKPVKESPFVPIFIVQLYLLL